LEKEGDEEKEKRLFSGLMKLRLNSLGRRCSTVYGAVGAAAGR